MLFYATAVHLRSDQQGVVAEPEKEAEDSTKASANLPNAPKEGETKEGESESKEGESETKEGESETKEPEEGGTKGNGEGGETGEGKEGGEGKEEKISEDVAGSAVSPQNEVQPAVDASKRVERTLERQLW